MSRFRYGVFKDKYRGDGWYASLLLSSGGWLLVAYRPKYWRLRVFKPPGEPRVSRLYVGPLEFERLKGPAS